VHVISTDEECERGWRCGARSVLAKPIKSKETLDAAFASIQRDLERGRRDLLLVSPDKEVQQRIVDMVADGEAHVTTADNEAQALAALNNGSFDGVIVTPGSDGTADLALAERLTEQQRYLPILYYDPKTLSKKDETHLRRLMISTRVKHVQSL